MNHQVGNIITLPDQALKVRRGKYDLPCYVNLLACKQDTWYPRRYILDYFLRSRRLVPLLNVLDPPSNIFGHTSGYHGSTTVFTDPHGKLKVVRVQKTENGSTRMYVDGSKAYNMLYLKTFMDEGLHISCLFSQFQTLKELDDNDFVNLCSGKFLAPRRYGSRLCLRIVTADEIHVLLYEPSSNELECLSMRDFVYRFQYKTVSLIVQSGHEDNCFVNYGKAKYLSRQRHKKKMSRKLDKVEEELKHENLGSRKKNTKKNFKKKVRTQHASKRTTQQSGTEKDDMSTVISVIEKFIGIYLFTYWDKPLVKGFAAGLLLFRGSVSITAYNVIKSMVSKFDGTTSTLKEFVDWLKSLLVDISVFKNNKYAMSFIKIISYIYTTFLCPTILPFITPITESSMYKKIMGCFSDDTPAMESILNAFTYLTNGVEVFIRTGSLDGFLDTQMSGDQILTTMRELRSKYNLYLTGDLEFIKGYKHYELLKDLDEFRTGVEFFRKSRRGIEAKQMEDMLKEIDKMMVECNKMEAHNKSRIQPYHFVLSSGSGISKTHIVKMLCNAVAVRNGFPMGPEYTYYLNQANSFQSGWKNFKSIVIVDDSAAMRVVNGTPTGVNLPDWLLRGANNVSHELLGAGIDEKGTLFNRSLVEGWASNSFDQQFHASARFPSAVNRRFQLKIVGRVRPEYTKTITGSKAKSSQIDYSKIPEEQRDTIAPDAWLFTVWVCEIEDTGIVVKEEFDQTMEEEVDNKFRYVKAVYNGKELKDISLQDMLIFIKQHSYEFFQSQQKVLEIDAKTNDIKNYCCHGLPKVLPCEECKNDLKIKPVAFQAELIKAKKKLKKLPKNFSSLAKFMLANQGPWKLNSNGTEKLITPCRAEFNPYRKYCLSLSSKIYTFRRSTGYAYSVVIKTWKTVPKSRSITGTIYADPDEGRFAKALLNLDLLTMVQSKQGTGSERVLNILSALKNMKIPDIINRVRYTANMIVDLRLIAESLVSTMKDWFDEFVCDVIQYFINKILNKVEEFISKPTSFIPLAAEGTVLGAYCYAKHPALKLPILFDYVGYLFQCGIMKAYEPTLVSTVPLDFNFTKQVYNKFIRTPTLAEKEYKKKTTPLSLTEYVMEAGLDISHKEMSTKKESPDLLRDLLLPISGLAVVTYRFIPALFKNLSDLYCFEQVGYEVSVEQITELDKVQADRWYLRKTDNKAIEPATALKSSSFHELENLVMRNTFYVCDLDTKRIVTALSVCNKFVLLPTHFCRAVKNHMARFVKVKIEDEEKPGNAFIEVNMDPDLFFELPGDTTLMYLEQCMDHMRTKDLLGYFPSAHCKDELQGRIYWKERKGVCKMTDAVNIRFNPDCSNYEPDSNSFTDFAGYNYEAENFEGLCGAVLLDHTHKASQILGIHVGGNVKSKYCVASPCLRQDLQKAISYFCPEGIIQQSGFTTESFGISIHEPTVYNKNPFLDTVDRIDGLEILGTVPKRFSPVAKVVYTPISEDVLERFGVKSRWGAPPFVFNGDKRHGQRRLIRNFASKKPLRHTRILKLAAKDFEKSLQQAIDKNPEFWKEELRILNEFEVVNGVAGKRYLGGLNMSSAFDFRFPGAKNRYAKQVNGSWVFDPFVMVQFRDTLGKMRTLQLTYEMCVQMLKNEATLETKIEEGKNRSYYMAPTPMQMIVRMFLLTTCRFYCLNTPYTETTVGINPHGEDWNNMCNELCSHEKALNIVALDLKAFDLTTQFLILSKAIDLLFYPILTVGNLSQEDRNVLVCIKHALLYSIVNVSGDLVALHGIIPSGTPVTSMLGCIVNSLNYRMAYYYYYPNTTKLFREVVCLRTFGDDSIANVRRGYPEMNVKSILAAFLIMGIQGTDLSKGTSSKRKYYKLHEVEFLKRGIVYSKEFSRFIGPLDLNSMFKCLSCHVPPKKTNIETVTGQCVDNFLFEAKFHGRKFYENARAILLDICTKHDLLRFTNTIFLTYDQQIALWRKNLNDAELITEQEPTNLWSQLTLFASDLVDSQNWFEWTQSTTINNNEIDDQNHAVDKMVAVPDRTQILTQQSGIEHEKQEVMTFIESDDLNSISIGSGLPEARVADNDCSLGEFLARPILIANWNWGTSTFNQELDPWNAVLNNKRVANRICNYSLFRAICRVKVIINGNGFYYGRLMMSYLPFADIDQQTVFTTTAQTSLIPMSQCPHIYIDPTLSVGGEMTLPFFYPADYVRLQDLSTERSLGKLLFYQIAQLKHANQDISSSFETISVSVYAWFENVELLGPTNFNSTGTTAQSGKETGDTKKPISQTCTAVASASSALVKIPVIGKYAFAVEQAAKTASTVASALGYCQPRDPQEPVRFQPRITSNMATTNTTDNSLKLSVDTKQDLTIDPTIAGLSSVDELSISRIAGIRSYLTRFTWALSKVSGDNLFSMYVTPTLFYKDPVLFNIYMTAICGAAIPFRYWTGSIKLKFTVISSSFHRGRLVFTYDPLWILGAREDNTNYTHIVDISETREIEITIGMYQKTQWLPIANDWDTETYYRPFTPLTAFLPWTNGVLNCYVLNELTSPNSDPTLNTDVSIMVEVAAGDDFRVAVPTDNICQYEMTTAQSGVEVADAIGDVDATEEVSHINVASKHQDRVYIGEAVDSFRTLLKRYNGYTRFSTSGAYEEISMSLQGYPAFTGQVDNVPYTGTNAISTTLTSYLMRAFAGWRGGVRWKVIAHTSIGGTLAASRLDNVTVPFSVSTEAFTGETQNVINFLQNRSEDAMLGLVMTDVVVNPCLDIEIPYYSEYKFIPGKPKVVADQYKEYWTGGFKISNHRNNYGTVSRSTYEFYQAGAEDLTFFFFTGWPPFTV